MIQHPGVLALLLASSLITVLLLAAGALSVQLLIRWDLTSGHESQLALERRTYLTSSLVANALALQFLSLFLFIYTADDLHEQFAGAMCAAGTLAAHPSGYPALALKLLACLGAGAWLAFHRADVQAHDYPLLRPKAILLLALVPIALAETWLQARYFLGLKPDVLTSCCGSLFGQGRLTLASDLAGLPHRPTLILFWALFLATLGLGAWFLRTQRGGWAFGILGTAFLPVGLAALISVFCLYIYELPTHHCPFCLLQRRHGFVGYPLYFTLLGGTLASLGAGILAPFRSRASLVVLLPAVQARFVRTALVLLTAFALIVGVWALLSPLRL